MESARYRLAEDVFACLSDGRLVFMDLQRNRYLCLGRRHSRAAKNLVGSFDAAEDLRAGDSDTAGAVIAALGRKGLLARGEDRDNDTSPHLPQASRSLLPDHRSCDARMRPGHLASFLRASLAASYRLRWQSMRRSVRSVADRPHEYADRNGVDDALSGLVAIFHRLRPYYGREYLCLFDSLSLLEFLARYGRFPRWVFAVRSSPFAAHCWVQEDDCVLNDTVDNVRGYTPIMTA